MIKSQMQITYDIASKLCNEISAQFNEKIYIELRDRIWHRSDYQFKDKIGNQVGLKLKYQLKTQIKELLQDKIKIY